jgi:hypothetical protein
MKQLVKLRTLGIDFGFAAAGESLGYSQFETILNGESARIAVTQNSLTTNLANFQCYVLPAIAKHFALLTLDAPITGTRIPQLPKVGRQVENRFSRGHFSNGRRGPQPSSIRVPRQGWPLYRNAMDFLEAINQAGFFLPTFPLEGDRIVLDLSRKPCVEVCPKLTQTLLTPLDRIAARTATNGQPGWYRKIDNWLFPHLFVRRSPINPIPVGGTQPAFGRDCGGLTRLLGENLTFDESVWAEAERIQATYPLTRRHELIGAFVAGIQGAIMLAGKASMFGAPGEYEGFYVLPSTWHEHWVKVWNRTAETDDAVRQVTVQINAENLNGDKDERDGGQ